MIIKFFVFFFYNLFMAFRSLFWIRDFQVILMGGWFGEKYADNPRFLFEYLSKNKNELELKRIVWVSHNKDDIRYLRDRGYEAYDMYSDQSKEVHKKAGIHIINNSSSGNGDILGQYSYGAKKINLWHGAGFKRVSYNSNSMKEWHRKHPYLFITYRFAFQKIKYFRKLVSKGGWADAYYLAGGEKHVEWLKSNFWLPDSNIVLSNYPRNCGCIELRQTEQDVINKMGEYIGCILYLPTFRDLNNHFDPNDVSSALEEVLKEKNILLLQKLHQASNKIMNSGMENVITLPSDFDINVLLPQIDVLITDYSTCAFDAMYYRKRVIYYIPDFEEYKGGLNGFWENPIPSMCGTHVYEKNKLCLEIQKIDFLKRFSPDNQYETIRNAFWENDKSLCEIWKDIVAFCDIKW